MADLYVEVLQNKHIRHNIIKEFLVKLSIALVREKQ